MYGARQVYYVDNMIFDKTPVVRAPRSAFPLFFLPFLLTGTGGGTYASHSILILLAPPALLSSLPSARRHSATSSNALPLLPPSSSTTNRHCPSSSSYRLLSLPPPTTTTTQLALAAVLRHFPPLLPLSSPAAVLLLPNLLAFPDFLDSLLHELCRLDPELLLLPADYREHQRRQCVRRAGESEHFIPAAQAVAAGLCLQSPPLQQELATSAQRWLPLSTRGPACRFRTSRRRS